jgi:hypothetical protein
MALLFALIDAVYEVPSVMPPIEHVTVGAVVVHVPPD